jgi:hypothetical protein
MTSSQGQGPHSASHQDRIQEQFTQQAEIFAASLRSRAMPAATALSRPA